MMQVVSLALTLFMLDLYIVRRFVHEIDKIYTMNVYRQLVFYYLLLTSIHSEVVGCFFCQLY